jgi:hypothetical protein
MDDRASILGQGLGGGGSSLRHRVQTGSGADTALYPMGTGGSCPGGTAAGAGS